MVVPDPTGEAAPGEAEAVGSEKICVLPTSLSQERFWVLDQKDPGCSVLNVAVRFLLEGSLRPELVERTFNEIVARHEVLRTTFTNRNGLPMQVIAPSLKIDVAMLDLRRVEKHGLEAEVDRLCLEEAQQHFDLAVGPLLRVSLIRTDDERYLLLLTTHHSIADYWSVGLIIGEFAAVYEAFASGSEPSLPEIRIQYGDFAVWEREQAVGQWTHSQIAFWQQQLTAIPRLDFPTDRQGTYGDYQADIVSRVLPLQLTDGLKDIANREGVTFFNLMLAALAIVVHRFTGQTDFGVGTQVAGRDSLELESLVGSFINTVVLRVDLGGDPHFRSLVRRIQETSAQSLANANVRFEHVLKAIRPGYRPSDRDLFSLNFICQRDAVKTRGFAGIRLTVLPSKSQGALYDLNVFLVLRGDGWRLSCEYKTGLFDEASILRLLDNYQLVLEAISQNPEQRISQFTGLDVPADSTPSRNPAGEKEGSLAVVHEAQSEGSKASTSEEFAEPPPHDRAPSGSHGHETYAFPITLNQQRFWVLDQLMPGNPTLNMPVALRLSGVLHHNALRRSLCELVRRHEMLRTTFTLLDGRPVQVIHPPAEVELNEIDLQNLSEPDREARAERILHEEALHPFSLSKGPLFRATLVRLASDDHILMLTMPHIVCDGWSNGIVVREVTSIYEAFSQELPSPLAEPPLQYADFAHWQNEWLKSASLDEDLAFWKKQLHGKLPLLDLPADRCARPGLVSRGATETLLLPADFVVLLKDFCKREELTMFMLLLAGFKAMLCRLTGQEDILVGSPIAGRMPETEGVVGAFSYPISLRTDLSGNPTFRELARRIRDTTVEALTHKDLPFGRILEELDVEQLRGRNPLFQIYFLHQVAFLQPVKTRDLSWSPYTWASPGTAFDLHLATVERREGIINRLEYNPDMFEAGTIKRMLQQYRSILSSILSDPELPISQLPFSPPMEMEPPSAGVTAGAPKESAGRSVLELFEQQSRKGPKKVAGILRKTTLTYRQLDSRANALAERLRSVNLGADNLVGICCDLSPDLMVAMIGTLKAGGTYVWLPARAATDSASTRMLIGRMKVVIADKRLTSWFLDRGIQFVFPLQRVTKKRSAVIDGPAVRPGVGSPACVRITAGNQKAVIVTHEALAARAAAGVRAYKLTAEDRVALVGSAGTEEAIVSVLTAGAAAVFMPPAALTSHAEVAAVVEKHTCSVMILAARQFEEMIVACERKQTKAFVRGFRLAVVHGDKPASKAIAALTRLTGGSVRCVSAYGTAETGSNAITWEAPSDFGVEASGSEEHLGLPSTGFEVVVVDRHLQPAPVGVRGEICVGGEGLARSYMGDTEFTAERFFTVPGVGTRLFKTGDLGRYLPDGRIEFLGPPHRHSNVRGFRRHFGDLELALMRHPRVKRAVALPSEEPSGNQRIMAYVVLEPDRAGRIISDPDLTLRLELNELIAQQCEGYPNALSILFVDDLSLNDNGNMDPRKLPYVNATDAEGRDNSSLKPRVLESKLIAIWEDLLGIRPIGIRDNFFDLGGHSFLALRLFDKVNALWGKTLPLSTLFQAPTIEGLAEILKSEGWSPPSSSLVAIRSEGARPPLYIISGIGGNVVRFHPLARHLNPDQPLYALQPPGIDGTLPYITNIEDMAAHYIREIKILQPAGPYYLAGYSFGGLVTFQMGCELVRRGQQIGLLALLDSPEWHYESRVAKSIGLRRRLQRYRARLSRILFEADRVHYIRERFGRRISCVIYSSFRRLGRDLPQSVGSINDINAFAASTYVPGVFPGRLTLLRTKAPSDGVVLDDLALGWEPLAREVEVHEVAGDHDHMTAEPHVQVLAQKLDALLIRSQAREEASTRVTSAVLTRGDNEPERTTNRTAVGERPFAGSLIAS
jgi:non-ribosomal peptide synthetase component F/thioesterase domain-containing protein